MNAIKFWIKERGLTLQKLGERLEPPASAGTISAYASESREMSMDRLRDIARALEVTPGQVLDGPPHIPTESELASMLAAAQNEIPMDRLTTGDYPSAVASALRARLLRYAGVYASDSVATPEQEKPRASDVRSPKPTKKASRG